jgi:predicted Ser/Thr protein kinase/cell division protein FtsN
MTDSNPTMPPADGDTTIVASGRSFAENWRVGGGANLKDSLDGLQARLAIPARYEVLDELGRGGMGIVYKVRDIETCETVAIKILKPGIAADPAMRENLRKEVCLARKVTHKNVCRIHEFTRSETTACISMEYVDGESLLSKLQRRGALAVADAVDIGQQICAGLREAHAQGIVHRDLKPANIVIAQDRTVKIMDFGVARRVHGTDQTTGTLAGTPAYMSPEQLEMRPVTASTDIYALGLVLYEMVTGTTAFSGENAIALALQQIRAVPKRPSEIVPTISTKLDAAILKCLEKDPTKRFASVDELSVALGKAIGPATSPSLPTIDFAKLEPVTAAARTAGRAALADLNMLGKILYRGASRVAETAQPKVEQWLAGVRRYNWRSQPSRKAQAVAFGIALFGSALVFGFMMRQETHAEQPIALAASARPATIAAPPVRQDVGNSSSSSPEPPAAFAEQEFEFQTTAAGAAADTTTQTDQEPAPAPAHRSADDFTSNPRLRRAAFISTTRKSKPQPLTAQTAPGSATTASVPNSSIASTLSASAVAIPLDNRDITSDALLALQPNKSPKAANTTTQAPQTLSEAYLEVGSFNDATWADDAVNQLSHLGFAAFAVHKSHLWMQSYRVEVGPFKTLNALESAEARLAADGFKSHAVK